MVQTIVNRIRQEGGWIVADEITTGMGRTGKWFGFQHYDIRPDIVALGKGLGNDYPVSAMAMRMDIARSLVEGGVHYAQSHQNDPLGCAVAREVIAVLREEGWIENREWREEAHSALVTQFLLPNDNVTKRAAQAVKDRCAQQEALDAIGLLVQNFLDQIIQHVTMAARERFDEAGGVFLPLHG